MRVHLGIAVLIVATGLAAGVPRAQESTTVYKPGNGVSLPVVTKQVAARYTSEAIANRIEGAVGLSVVVRSNGSVGDVQVTRSLDTVYGLDQEAIKAMKQWEFKPGTKDDKPVAVQVSVDIRFALK